MYRYFIQLAYKGTAYSGFQVQENANTVQAEVERALAIYYKKYFPNQVFELTGSSRTDAGVHAHCNYFHMDVAEPLGEELDRQVYHINAILPGDIVLQRIIPVPATAHSRFDAVERCYCYYIYQHKAPFLADRAYYYPYIVDRELLQAAAAELLAHTDFSSFSKRNSQIHTHICQLTVSEWRKEGDCWVYEVRGNRFLRGMVRGLVGTMMRVGRKKLPLEGFKQVILDKDCTKADFSVPGHGLFLMEVGYPEGYFER